MSELKPKEVAERIKIWLKSEYGSIDEGARRLGKTPVNLRNSVLKGRTLPSTDFMAEIVKRGADYSWIIFGSGNIVKEPTVRYKVKKLENEIGELKEQNNQLRSSISKINSMAAAAEKAVKKRKKRKSK